MMTPETAQYWIAKSLELDWAFNSHSAEVALVNMAKGFVEGAKFERAKAEKVREETIKECAEIAQKEFQEHTGFAGDFDAGAATVSRNIKEEIEALLEHKASGNADSNCRCMVPHGKEQHGMCPDNLDSKEGGE